MHHNLFLLRYHLAGHTYQKCQDVENGVWFQKIPLCEGRLEKHCTVVVGVRQQPLKSCLLQLS